MRNINTNYLQAGKKLGFKSINTYKLFFDLDSADPIAMVKGVTQAEPGDILCVVAPFCIRMKLLYAGYKLLEFINDYRRIVNDQPSCKGVVIHWVDFNEPTYKVIYF
jgi:hypothetical protein